jgi:anti-sigma-K factor RskA
VSDSASGHDPFEELAAGYALDALDPADEQLYLEHARGCAQCTRALAGYREVAAALAETAPPAEPSAQLGDRILAMARADLDPARRASSQAAPSPAAPSPAAGQERPGQQGPGTAAAQDAGEQQTGPREHLPPGVHRLHPRRSRWLRPVSIAAAAALIAAGGVWGGLKATSSGPARPAAFCEHGCSEIVLTAKGTHQVAGKVFVQRQSVWMQPTDMKPDDTADQIYVLWQITGSKHPLAVGSFDVRKGTNAPIDIGPLAAPYHGTVAFAVSLEHGRSIPASPSSVAAIGQVT